MKRAEDNAQVAIVRFLRANGLFCFHVKNQGKWSPAYGAKLKRMGRVKGMADLGVITPTPSNQLPRGMFMLETKRPPDVLPSGKLSKAKPKLSQAQEDVAATLATLGIPTIVACSIDEAERAMIDLGVQLKARAR